VSNSEILFTIKLLALEKGQFQVKKDFAKLINYFESETPNFQVLFVSSLGLFNGKRLGIKDLMTAVLQH
jgi:hypothetical protein